MAISVDEFPTTITLPDTAAHEITIDNGIIDQSEAIDVTIEITAAATTVQACIGQAPTAESPAWAVGKEKIVTIHKNGKKLFLKGALNDTIVIS